MVQLLQMPPKIIQGVGALNQLNGVSLELEISHLFVIISKRNQQEMNAITKMMESEKIKIEFFHKSNGEPTTKDVEMAVEAIRQSGANGVAAIGGGSILDLAKAVAVIAENEQLTVSQLHEEVTMKRSPLIAVPTTAGTGSEVTKISVITDSEKQIKYNPGHKDLIPDVVILDANLTITMPKSITAQTGMDAFAHALEAYVSTNANDWTDLLALEAIELINHYLPITYKEASNIIAREKMLYASSLAGIAFSNASTNLAHATARALGTKMNLPHGLSVAIMLPPVIEFTMEVASERYNQVTEKMGVKDLTQHVHLLNRKLRLYENVRKMINISQLKKLIPSMTKDALSGNGILTNRKVPTEKDVREVFEKMILNIQEEL